MAAGHGAFEPWSGMSPLEYADSDEVSPPIPSDEAHPFRSVRPTHRRDSCTARHLMQRTPRADADLQNRSRSGICRKSWILELSRSATTIVPSSSTATAGGVLN